MKILVITDHYRAYPENGSEVFCSELVNVLSSSHEIDVLARAAANSDLPRWMIDDAVANDFEALGLFLAQNVDTTCYDLVYNLGGLIFGCRVVQMLQAFNPDLPLVNHYQALLGPYAEAEGKNAREIEDHAACQLQVAANARLNIFISHAEHRAAVSSGMYLAGGGVWVIPNGLSFKDFDQVRGDRSFLPPNMHDALVIATAGRFSDSVKGADLVYRAFAQLAAENPEVFLISIGNSDRFSLILREVPADRWLIEAWMSRQQFLSTLAGADLVVMPSRHEPFGLIALEALALGVPVIANRVGGLAEFVRHGEFGMLNPPGDGSFGLYTAMRSLVSKRDRLAEMGRAGRAHVMDHYSISRIAELVNAALQTAVGLGSPADQVNVG
jgi:glycosyltransferase involved in cell wall biosynthesis